MYSHFNYSFSMKPTFTRLSVLRKAKNLTLQETAKQCDVSYSTIRDFDKGIKKKTTLTTAKKVANYFNIPLTDFEDYITPITFDSLLPPNEMPE